MLRTTSLISNLSEVPREWVFEYYLKLGEPLTGQDLKVTSVFNPAEKTPSMSIFYSKSLKSYRFKDFSTNNSGDGTSLVQLLFNLTSRGEAAHKIIEDYNQWKVNDTTDYSLRVFKQRTKYRVTQHEVRSWNTLDKNYWLKYHIGSRILDFYKVKPLELYTMSKTEDDEYKELRIKGNFIYGYFRKDGTLYKIYQPKIKDSKFIKVKDYIQGSDQLTYNTDFLAICSSLKDMMALKKLGFANIESVAPDSENISIPENIIQSYKQKYKNICTIFDNDSPGIKSMQQYKAKYDIDFAHLTLEKDLSDSLSMYSVVDVRNALTPLLQKALKIK